MNNTVTNFVAELKSKPLAEYSLEELQKSLQECYNLYKRFKNEEERSTLNQIWNKIAGWYNVSFKELHPMAWDIYIIDYLKNQIK